MVTRGAGNPGESPDRKRGISFTWQHLLIGVATLMAFVLNLLVFQQQDAVIDVAVAVRDLVPGDIIDDTALTFEEVPADFAGAAALVGTTEIGTVGGQVVLAPVPAGSPIRSSDLGTSLGSGGSRAMSIPVAVEHAVGATLVIGDRIDVITVSQGTAEYVANGLEVIGLADTADASFGGSGSFYLIVALDEQEALAVAAAIAGEHFEVVRSTGSGGASR